MEILNNIWAALSTENEMLINTFSIPCTFLESFIMFLLFTSILKINYTRRQKIIFISLFALTTLTAYYFIPAPYYSLLDYIIMFVLIKNIFKLSTIKSILCILSSFFVYSVIGSLIINLFVHVFNLTFHQINSIPIYRMCYIFTVYIFLIMFIKLLNIKNLYLKLLDNITPSNRKIILVNLVIGLITLCVQLFITFYYSTSYTTIFAILNFICFVTYLCVSILSLNRTMNLQLKTTQLESAENSNKTLTNLYDNVRGFKHDFNNMIDLIGGYIDHNDMEGLKKYYNGLRKDCVRVNNSELLNPNIINNSGIYNLIISKQNKATKLKVKISLEVFFDFDNLHMPIYEFSRILGILLDNAIEAASECKIKQVNLMFRESKANHTQIISIENTYNDKNVNTKTIFEKGISSKKNHTGIGLWEINKIISQNNNIVLHTSKDEKYFKQQLEIYY